jgi:serine protease Do
MTRKNVTCIAVMFTLIGLIIGLGVSSNFNLGTMGYSQDVKISKQTIDTLSRTNEAMAEVAAAVKPAVVNISTSKTIKTQGIPSPFFNDPFFKRFFGDEFGHPAIPREHKEASLGSGVIVNEEGYIVTNNHVIKDADEINVKLGDKREFKGKVVGADPKTDIAVIRIDAKHLPVLKLGDSDKLRVGETILAVGNPFGLNQTVTSGIVSATGRANMGIEDYENFIQTDAAINPGNSGGAMVNISGELVGINTAIFSTSGGYMGIGFAIPSNMVKVVMDSLIKRGKVIRGWLGVSIQPISEELAKQFKLKDRKGALIADVVEGSPAEKAGLKRGDVIIELNGNTVEDTTSLRNAVAAIEPGTTADLKFIRDGKVETAKITISELTPEAQKAASGNYNNMLKGVDVQDLNHAVKKDLGIPGRVTGVIVTSVDENSPAAGVLQQNDVIMEVNRKKVNNAKDYEAVVARIGQNQGVLLLVYRNGSVIYITLG